MNHPNRSSCTRLDCYETTQVKSRSELTAIPNLQLQPCQLLPVRIRHCSAPELPSFWTTLSQWTASHYDSTNCGFFRGNTFNKVRVAADFNVTVQRIHKYLQAFREYLIVQLATLSRAMRSLALSEAIFRINSLTEDKRSSLSIARNSPPRSGTTSILLH